MQTTRRQFIRGLLATAATVAIAPQVIVEPFHGASDLTPAERDVVADLLGLRQKQWTGWSDELARDAMANLKNFLVLNNGEAITLEMSHTMWTFHSRPGGIEWDARLNTRKVSTLLHASFDDNGHLRKNAWARLVFDWEIIA